MELAEVIGLVVLVAVALAIVVIAVRRALLSRAGGFDVSWRDDLSGSDRGWSLGQGRYRGGELDLYRSFSPLPIASRTLHRNRLMLGANREPVGAEPDLLPMGAVIVRCTDGGAPFELALSGDALTGLKAWVEARPPGSRSAPGGIVDGRPRGAPDT
jgi:hypothetical protein